MPYARRAAHEPLFPDQVADLRALAREVRSAGLLEKFGEHEGHPFRGNQWTLGHEEVSALKGHRKAGNELAALARSALPREVLDYGASVAKDPAIVAYQNYGAVAVGEFLRTGAVTVEVPMPVSNAPFRAPDAAALVPQLDRILAAAPALPARVALYSGLSGAAGRQFQPGESFESQSFLSTSLSPAVAQRFASAFGPGGGKDSAVLFRLQTDGRLRGVAFKGSEHEVLLPRGQKFIVERVDELRTKVDWKASRNKSNYGAPGSDPLGTKYPVNLRVVTLRPA